MILSTFKFLPCSYQALWPSGVVLVEFGKVVCSTPSDGEISYEEVAATETSIRERGASRSEADPHGDRKHASHQ